MSSLSGAGGAPSGVAIVGLACRFPAAPDPAAFWALLAGGRDAVGELPAHRLADAPGLAAVDASARRGGFLERIDELDAGFFGISPREAAMVDPQQRLVLELGWEALEDAGIVPARLRGSRVGVFVGAMWGDWAALVARSGGRE